MDEALIKAEQAVPDAVVEERVSGLSPPEANNLIWNDTFFEGEEDVVAVFDFDYALMEDFYTKTRAALLLYPPVFILSSLVCVPCFLVQNVKWDVNSKHVAVTRDGIRFVQDHRKTLCGLECTDSGRKSKTIPFDKITDCDIEEPGGNTCICIKNVLSTVNVDTASSGQTTEGLTRHELTISGLKDPFNFKKLVWALKRSNRNNFQATSARAFGSSSAPSTELMLRDNENTNNEETNSLLRQIRDELREQTALIKESAGK